jgi:leucyl/phenylalanyl-tRNA--protein transferase
VVRLLSRRLAFPDPSEATKDGLLAVGGDLSVERLLLAYRSGIFPWPVSDHLLTWFSPNPRAIFELDDVHVSRSLAKRRRNSGFEVRVDSDFEGVIRGCAKPGKGRPSTWIWPEMIDAYLELHRRGAAHSVETWREGSLVGGLYGVSIAGLFAGESMFSRESDASKVALLHLVERMKARGMSLLDVQVMNPHLERLGAVTIPRSQYLERLKKALAAPVSFA